MNAQDFADAVQDAARMREVCSKARIDSIVRLAAIMEDELSDRWDALVLAHPEHPALMAYMSDGWGAVVFALRYVLIKFVFSNILKSIRNRFRTKR